MSKQKKNPPFKITKEDLIHHPDDALAKYFLSHKAVAEEIIRFVLPPALCKILDFNSMEHAKDTYVTQNLKARYADIAFNLNFKGKRKKTRVRFIKEPKSRRPKKGKAVSPQLMQYCGLSMDYDQRMDMPMAFPVLILIHHGRSRWEKEVLADFFKDVPEEFLFLMPTVKFLMLDVSDIDDDILTSMNFNFADNFLFALKYGRTKKGLLKNFEKIFIFAEGESFRDLSENLFEALFTYVNYVSPLNSEEMTNLANTLPPKRRNKAKTLMDQWEEKGLEKGLEKGIHLTTEKKNREFGMRLIKNFPDLSDSQIAELVGTDTAFIKKLRSGNPNETDFK